MHTAVLESIIAVVALLVGIVLTAGASWSFAIAPSRRAARALEASLGSARSELAAECAKTATARADAENALRRVVELRSSEAELVAKLDASATRAADIGCRLASAMERIEQMKLGERDVEERLQRVAATYVDEAREVLVKAAAERFAGDADAFRERLVAQVAPLNERIDVLGKSLTDLGTVRAQDQTRVATLLEGLDAKMAGIDDATKRVERVLGNSQARGSWGEFELKRLLELTGMTQHISFDTQLSGFGTDAAGRPDVVLRIPGDLIVPIDAKVPFARYQQAVSAQTESDRETLLVEAVAAVRAHVKVLGARKYHAAPKCVGWTIMFVPIEAMLSTLFSRDHQLLETAREARVMIASPLTLMLYLEAFSRNWAAQKQSDNAALILDHARDLVSRLGTFTEKFSKVGSTLNSAIEKYNEAVATYEGRIGPQAKKIAALRGEVDEPASVIEQAGRARAIDGSRLPSPLTLAPSNRQIALVQEPTHESA